MSKRKGFTLIELFIVIAIIVILAAILFPVFVRVREKARAAACQSNLRQIALAFQQYNSDNDHRFPHAWDMDMSDPSAIGDNRPFVLGPTDEPVLWPAKLLPYLKNRQIYSCPSRRVNSPSTCRTYTARTLGWSDSQKVMETGSTVYPGAGYAAYGYNFHALGGGQVYGEQGCVYAAGGVSYPNGGNRLNNGIGALESSLAAASATVLLCDNSFTRNGATQAGITQMPAFAQPGLPNDIEGDVACTAAGGADDRDSFDPIHNDGLNVAFADGHVKWLKKEVLLARPATGLSCSTVPGASTGWLDPDPKFIWNRL